MAARRILLSYLALTAVVLCSACGRPSESAAPPIDTGLPQDQASLTPDGGGTLAIAFLGDSLTAGLGLPAQEAYPHRIEQMFGAEGYREVEVVNAGISGDTTAGGRRRVDQILAPDVKVLVLALGANDALRGLTVAQTYENLAATIEDAQARGVTVLLAGMEAPINLGEDYRTAFRNVFSRLAREYSLPFVPFLLQGVAGDPALNQGDGIHPNAEGARRIAELMYPKLRDIVDQQTPSAR